MSATWTQEAILHAQEAQQTFKTNGEWIGAYLAFGSFILLALLGLIQKDIRRITLWPATFFAIMFSSTPVALLLTYFSPPTWLTLGHEIGGFMPTSCETSKLIEGPNSLPCHALYFKWWLAGVAGPDGWLYLARPHPIWVAYLLLFFMELFIVGMICSLPSFDRMLERREQERKQKMEQQRKWDIERGVARGIEEWKVSRAFCINS
jgi:hypothetical protein